MKPIRLFIVGAGGHGGEVLAYAERLRALGVVLRIEGFVDEGKPAGRWRETPLLGGLGAMEARVSAEASEIFHYITALGSNSIREALVQRIESLGLRNLRPWTLVHPEAHRGPEVEIGEGTCVAPGVVLTTHVKLGRHCIVNVKASISHDCEIGDFANINPGATLAGNVRVGHGSFVGAGATVIEKVKIGSGVVIGAGSVVIRDVSDNMTVVGVPAAPIQSRKGGRRG